MKGKKYRKSILLSVLFSLVTGGVFSQDPTGFEKTNNGLLYKYYRQNEEAKKPNSGDVLDVTMFYTSADSIIFDSRNNPNVLRMMIKESQYKGDIYEALQMLAIGDSALFLISADSFFLKSVGMQQLPDFIKSGSLLHFNIRLNSIQTKAEYEAEQKKIMDENQKRTIELKQKELSDLREYLIDNKINVTPTKGGLYYINIEEGTGEQAIAGKTVKVHYLGTLFNGKKFDSSYDRGEPFEFQLGAGQVIKGWDEGIALMKVGGKAKLIIPSHIGYGESVAAGGLIAPFSTLVFEVELLEVK